VSSSMRHASLVASIVSAGCVTGLTVTREATLATNATAPEFTLAAQTGEATTLASALANGPVVLVFYRGHW
jgi:hypothetical protein